MAQEKHSIYKQFYYYHKILIKDIYVKTSLLLLNISVPLHPSLSSHCKYLISKTEAPLGLKFYSKPIHNKNVT